MVESGTVNPGDLVRHRHFIPSRIFMYIGPEIPPESPGRFTAYQTKMVRVVEVGDPALKQLRFHESYLSVIS